jgi:hypothetical protein
MCGPSDGHLAGGGGGFVREPRWSNSQPHAQRFETSERRGGRQRATPNKRTMLTDRILATASSNPIASSREILLILVKDQALPAATRIAIAQKSFRAGRASLHFRAKG